MKLRTTTTLLAFALSTALAAGAMPAFAQTSGNMGQSHAGMANMANADSNWFGGPIYKGQPALAATAALVKAGGGADNFKFSTALVSMLGTKAVNGEVAKLSRQYGKAQTQAFVKDMTFYVNDALKRATEKGIKLPPPADLHGAALAKALVKAGTTPDGTFWSGYFFDRTISHGLHNQVMADVDAKYSHKLDGQTHKMLNQAMYDIAQDLGMKNVKLASFH